jgi:hypothetical protein
MANSILDAIRGPVMLIAWGTLFAADQMDRMSILRTWPIIVILYGLFKLAERMVARAPAGPPELPGETNS